MAAAVDGTAVAVGTGAWGAWVPWRVEGMAKAGVWQALVGVAKGAYAGVDSPAEGAVRGRTGRAGKAIEWDRCVSCCACGSRVAAIPSQTALRSHNSAIVLWRASTVCRMPCR